MSHVHKEWSSEFAVRTEEIFRRAEQMKPASIRFIDASLPWIMLFLAVLGNFVVSVVLVPLLLILKGWLLYLVLFLIGSSFGWAFSFILSSVQKIRKPLIILPVFIPSLALINVGIFAVLSNRLISLLHLSTPPHNPFIVGASYVLGYIIPYLLLRR